MTEVINRSIYEGYQNEGLFDFLEESILVLDQQNSSLSHFPLVFLIEKAKYLGFAPDSAEGFLIESIHHPFSSEEIGSTLDYLNSMLKNRFETTLKIPVSLRRKLLDHLLEFYSEHLEHPSPIKSLAIIRQLMT
jgi:DNA repair protein RecO (recombination protein O)